MLFQADGVLAVGGNFIIEGKIEVIDEVTFDIGGYYKHISGQIAFSGTITLNISTNDELPAGETEHNFFIGVGDATSGARYDFGANVNMNINLQNGHANDNVAEIYLEQADVQLDPGGTAHMVTTIDNGANDDLYIIETDMGLGEVDINMGAGNVHRFKNISPDITPNYWILNVNSGEFEMEDGARLTILGQISGTIF